MKRYKTLKVIALGLFVIFTNIAMADIEVIGKSKVQVMPDTAIFTVSVESKAKTAKEAVAQNASQTTDLVGVLQDNIVEKNAVTTSGYSLYPDYQYNDKTRKSEFVGFVVNNQVNVKTKDLANVGKLLDLASTTGATTISNLQFISEKSEESFQQGLAKAVANAVERANILAAAGSLKIADIESIQVLSNNDFSVNTKNSMRMMSEFNAGAPTPVEIGNISVEVSVLVIFRT